MPWYRMPAREEKVLVMTVKKALFVNIEAWRLYVLSDMPGLIALLHIYCAPTYPARLE